jgi:hypothetical protein
VVAYAPDARLTQTELAELLEQAGMFVAYSYQRTEDELIRLVAKYVRRGIGVPLTLTDRLAAIQELQREALRIVDRIHESDLARTAIAVGAQEGEAAAVRQLGFLPTGATAAATSAVPATSAAAVAQITVSLTNSLTDMRQRITRWAPDAYRNVIALFSQSTVAGVATIDETRKRAAQQFLSQGITGFTDQAGRDWRIGSYSEMAARTTVKRAWEESNIARLTAPDTDIRLGTIVGGVAVCKFCAPWIGRVVSLDGTPAGTYQLQHATEDRFVSVTVKGSIDDARRAGWGHPNCRCTCIGYMPGLSLPRDESTYDPQAEKDRDRLRALERRVRSWKRREAAALDDIEGARARRKVREAQAAIRKHVADTGVMRDNRREQLAFSEGSLPPVRPRAIG